MSANKLVIANLALSKLGARPITSFIEEGSNEAVAINAVWEDVLEEVLSEFPWSFAQRRAALQYVVPDDVSRTIQQRVFTPVDITGATSDEPVVITAANHGLANGDRIKIVGVAGMTELNNNFYTVSNATRTTFELVDPDTFEEIDGEDYTTYTSGGQIYLANYADPILITAATAAEPVVITSAAHGLEDDDWIKIVGVKGMTQLNDEFYIVAGVTTNTFELTDTDGEDVDGSAFTAYTSGGQIYAAPDITTVDNSAVVVYQKPTDFIKPIRKNNKYALLQVEEDKIISNVQDLALTYTFINRDTTAYFPKFVQAFATRLAAEIAFRITNSVSKSEGIMKLYLDVALPTAVAVESTIGTPEEANQDEWLDAMRGGERFVPNPNTWHMI